MTPSFEHVVTFVMDEYVGLPREHSESYHSFMWKHLFQHVNIKREHVHILDGNAMDLAAECLKVMLLSTLIESYRRVSTRRRF